jgi:hypothetical protein
LLMDAIISNMGAIIFVHSCFHIFSSTVLSVSYYLGKASQYCIQVLRTSTRK